MLTHINADALICRLHAATDNNEVTVAAEFARDDASKDLDWWIIHDATGAGDQVIGSTNSVMFEHKESGKVDLR